MFGLTGENSKFMVAIVALIICAILVEYKIISTINAALFFTAFMLFWVFYGSKK